MVEQRTLTPLVLVRVQVSQPLQKPLKINGFFLFSRIRENFSVFRGFMRPYREKGAKYFIAVHTEQESRRAHGVLVCAQRTECVRKKKRVERAGRTAEQSELQPDAERQGKRP